MKIYKVGMILLITMLTMSSASIAQTFSGSIGQVVNHNAWIDLNTWTRKFRGAYEFVPGVWVSMTGSAKDGRFKVDGWFTVPARITANSILGDGVQLWKMSGGVRRGNNVSSLRPRLGSFSERRSSGGARSGSRSISTSAPSAIGIIPETISDRFAAVVG